MLIRQALAAPRRPAHEVLELDPAACRARKAAAMTLDLNGTAKGYGVDRLADTLLQSGIEAALVGIADEMRRWACARTARPGPDPACRAAHSLLALQDAAVATSGDYRHRVRFGGRDLSHTIDPRRGPPLLAPPASVTVVAQTCAEADAWASALMVPGELDGATLARRLGLDALFLLREGDRVRALPVGRLFGAAVDADDCPAA